jgi:outer membrane protein assembly factor BamE (lipoprotein component of BamABCDE complex)
LATVFHNTANVGRSTMNTVDWVCEQPVVQHAGCRGRDASPAVPDGGKVFRSRRVEGIIMTWRMCLPAGLLLACLSSASLLSGCAGFGNESIANVSDRSLSAQLIRGKTRQDRVRELYGEPAKISSTDGGLEMWEYDYSRLLAATTTESFPYVGSVDVDNTKKSLVIVFSKSKIVQKFTLNTSKIDFSGGLLTQ